MQRALTAAYVSGWRPFVCQVPRSVGKSCQGHCRSASSFGPQGSTDLIFQGSKKEGRQLHLRNYPVCSTLKLVYAYWLPALFSPQLAKRAQFTVSTRLTKDKQDRFLSAQMMRRNRDTFTIMLRQKGLQGFIQWYQNPDHAEKGFVTQ